MWWDKLLRSVFAESVGRLSKLGLLGCVGALALSKDYVIAQSTIVPDTTLGSETSTVTSLDSTGFPIDVMSGGAIRGVNLFHSFQEFNIAPLRGGYFLNPSNTIQNILTRVTGKNRSEILGTLGILNDVGITSRPNLFFMNPNGIIFGRGAQLDINGLFVATTANAIPDNSSIQNSLSELTENLIDTDALIANSCIARSHSRQEGSFIITGSGGLPNRPGDPFISSYATSEVRNVENGRARLWQKGNPIVEPSGVYRLPSGKLILSRECSL